MHHDKCHDYLSSPSPRRDQQSLKTDDVALQVSCIFWRILSEPGSPSTPIWTGNLPTLRSEWAVAHTTSLADPLLPLVADFRQRFGHDPEYYFGPLLERLENEKLLTVNDKEIRLTDLGTLFGYNVAKEFYSDEIRMRGQKLAESLARKRDVEPGPARSNN